jgi:hypothetical protein
METTKGEPNDALRARTGRPIGSNDDDDDVVVGAAPAAELEQQRAERRSHAADAAAYALTVL